MNFFKQLIIPSTFITLFILLKIDVELIFYSGFLLCFSLLFVIACNFLFNPSMIADNWLHISNLLKVIVVFFCVVFLYNSFIYLIKITIISETSSFLDLTFEDLKELQKNFKKIEATEEVLTNHEKKKDFFHSLSGFYYIIRGVLSYFDFIRWYNKRKSS